MTIFLFVVAVISFSVSLVKLLNIDKEYPSTRVDDLKLHKIIKEITFSYVFTLLSSFFFMLLLSIFIIDPLDQMSNRGFEAIYDYFFGLIAFCANIAGIILSVSAVRKYKKHLTQPPDTSPIAQEISGNSSNVDNL